VFVKGSIIDTRKDFLSLHPLNIKTVILKTHIRLR